MCWEMDYWYYAEQEKAKNAKAREERDGGVIKNLLNEANQEADKTNPETVPVMRSWISATSSLASVVITANVRIHSPEAGSFQFSHKPPMPNGRPSFMAIA
jgi:hypothetical protein